MEEMDVQYKLPNRGSIIKGLISENIAARKKFGLNKLLLAERFRIALATFEAASKIRRIEELRKKQRDAEKEKHYMAKSYGMSIEQESERTRKYIGEVSSFLGRQKNTTNEKELGKLLNEMKRKEAEILDVFGTARDSEEKQRELRRRGISEQLIKQLCH